MRSYESLEAVHICTHQCFKENCGITLVALVVTIVVLLILAGVSINLVIGQNGLISRGKEAREKMQDAEANEKTSMDSTSDWILEVANGTELPQTNETKPYMPGDGFTKVDGTNLANGLVIQDADGNQYVWVEVPMTEKVYLTAKLGITEFNEEAYTKIENDLHTYTTTYRNGTIWVDEYYEDKADGWYTEEQYTEKKQKMLKSVYQNGGFWVARYEAGISEENNRTAESPTPTIVPQSKKNLIPYNYVTRTQAKKLAEMIQYTKNGTMYKGSLIFGIQWDLILKFIETKSIENDKNIIAKMILDSTAIGNYKNSTFKIDRGKYAILINGDLSGKWNLYTIATKKYVNENSNKIIQGDEKTGVLLTTGAAEQNRTMNIYDMAGNAFEWTLEYSMIKEYPCAGRGGICFLEGFNSTATYRGAFRTSDRGGCFSFRISLY